MAQTSSEAAPSLAEEAYRTLEEKLVALELPPGAVISERDLIETCGLGRTPVREAMQRLAQQGLFQVMPRKGLLVTPVDRADTLHILEARKPLERLIVYRAALNARDAQRSELAAEARALTISHDSYTQFATLEQQLCATLDACSGNRWASAAAAPMRSHCRRFLNFHRAHLQMSDAISALSSMARLVARRDFNGAKKASDGVIAVLERLVASVERLG